jgi:hypothetical protein
MIGVKFVPDKSDIFDKEDVGLEQPIQPARRLLVDETRS